MDKYLIELIKKYPLMDTADIIKYCFQKTFGAEHLLSNVEMARKYFDEEYDSVEELAIPPVEVLSENIARVNFTGFKYLGGKKEALWQAFLQTAILPQGTEAEFITNINTCKEVITEYFPKDKASKMLQEIDNYLKNGIHPVHHSAQYRENYNPHYRVVLTKLANNLL